ncbi:MAG: LysR family transcriptional regulator, partial [Rhizobiales bacterium]|nr:LysR family transcriptional regulator [Hyphomicrobiales bacterium]
MNLALYQIFVEVAKIGSFAALARKMNSDPSSISRQIAALEDRLGYRLFERSTRRLVLTEAGQLTFDRIQNPIEEILDIQNLARDAVTHPQGTLRVGTSVAFGERWLVPKLSGFGQLYPEITIELVLSDSTTDLIAEKIDLTIRLGDRPSGPYVCQRLMTTHYHVVASPDYLEIAGLPSKPVDIKSHNCIAFPFPGYRSLWQFKSANSTVEKIEFTPS